MIYENPAWTSRCPSPRQLHHPDPATPIDESLRALDDVIQAGKAHYVGCSNHFAYQMARARLQGLEADLKGRLDELTREYRWGDDIR